MRVLIVDYNDDARTAYVKHISIANDNFPSPQVDIIHKIRVTVFWILTEFSIFSGNLRIGFRFYEYWFP